MTHLSMNSKVSAKPGGYSTSKIKQIIMSIKIASIALVFSAKQTLSTEIRYF